MGTPFKMAGISFGNLPLKGNNTPTSGGEGETAHADILKKYSWGGKTREEVKSTIKFNTSNQLQKQKKRDFYKIYGTAN